MSKKRVYVESSVVSYLTARPASDLIKLAKQKQTWDWWECRDRWELFISPVVVREIRDGDPVAATKRVLAVEGLQVLLETDEVDRLADHLLVAKVIPEGMRNDAMHIATAVIHGMDYLATWNQTHLFNPECIEKLYLTIRKSGYKPPVLVRPDNLLEKKNG